MRIRVCMSGFLLAAMACAADITNTTKGAADTVYTGSWTGGQSDRSNLTGSLTFTVVNGVMTGDAAPISGSTRIISGTVSASGAVTASIPADVRGCSVAFSGQITTAAAGASTGTGTYTLLASATCNTNSGTWTATRPTGG